MSKSVKIEMNGEEEIEFSGTCVPGIPARGPSYSSGGEPAEPAEVEDLYVGVIIKGTAIDITTLLSEKQREYFEEQLLVEAEESRASAYEDDCDRKFEEMRDERIGR